jgi:general nucleoside transport system permease protein
VTPLAQLVLRYVAAVALGAAVALAVVLAQGQHPGDFFAAVYDASFGSIAGLLDLVRWATPLALSGLAFAVAYQAGVFNIGVEGQACIGAFAASLVGRYVDLPAALLPPACLAAGAAAAALWTWPLAWLHRRHGVNEVVTTLMMNYVAVLFCNLVTREIFLAPSSQTIATGPVSATAMIPRLSAQSDANWSFALVLLLLVLAGVVMTRTRYGYELTIAGRSPGFARYAGAPFDAIRAQAFLISAALGGLVGATEAVGVLGRYLAGAVDNIGFSGVLVSLVGLNAPIGVGLAAIFFGVLKNSELAISQMGSMSSYVVTLISASFIIVFASDPLNRVLRRMPGGRA